MENNKVLNLYPIDYPFETLVNRVNKKKLILDPDFQRKYKWDKDGNERSSKFIESCLMRIPIPACYFAENQNSAHLVIDGVQRITTIKRFFNNEFELENLTVFKELEGKRFDEIGNYKDELENTTMRCIILRKNNPKSIVNEIFARLNQGAVELSKQEIRHAIYPGNLNKLLIKLSEEEIIEKFAKGEKGKKEKNNREGEEIVLRFFAMQDDKLIDYKNNLSKYFDNYMEENQNMSDEKINKMEKKFNETMEKCKTVFEKKVFFFYKEQKTQGQRQSLLIYDLVMWGFGNYEIDLLNKNKEKIKKAFEDLCKNNDFKKITFGGLADKSAILKRRKLWSNSLKKIINE